MRAIVCGMTSVEPSHFLQLEEPKPYELSIHLRDKIIFAETPKDYRKFLTALRQILPENSTSAQRIIESFLVAPKSRTILAVSDCDIEVGHNSDVEDKLIGAQFVSSYDAILVEALSGTSRDTVFEGKLKRYCISASSVTIMDRYLGINFSGTNFATSGCNWALEKILNSDIPNIQIVTATKNSNPPLVAARIQAMLTRAQRSNCVRLYFGSEIHDRWLVFDYTGSAPSLTLTIGKGLEVFKDAILQQACLITHASTAEAIDMKTQALRAISHSYVL